ncbi:MAG: TlpA family protein disulfide reductase [Gemmatimonadetes bacterium]|nr:TlpA family protein disulfide reductase [Gemmatimonadota bacterium]
MRKPLAVVCALIVGFALGMLLPGRTGVPAAAEGDGDPALEIPAAAARMWFPPAEQFANGAPPLSDESLEELLAALDVAMTAEETLADFEREADVHLWNFMRRLAVPVVGEEQQERIKAYLDALAEKHPESRTIEHRKRLVDSYAGHTPQMPSFSNFVLLFRSDGKRYPDPGEPFEDAQVDRMLAELDVILNLPESTGRFDYDAGLSLRNLVFRLRRGLVSDDQTARIVAYLDGLGERFPDAVEKIDEHRFLVENLTPGRIAPNIVGKDTEGIEFELEDYRGKIVALLFSGEWCGPCRAEYPYQRAMLEAFRDRDVVLLGINSDAVLDTIVQAKERERLGYRTWWDGHGQPDAGLVAADGPIATQWRVDGWPTTYVLDEEGVIRHIDRRGGSLFAALDRLLKDKTWREQLEEAEAEEEADESDSGTEEGSPGTDRATPGNGEAAPGDGEATPGDSEATPGAGGATPGADQGAGRL